MTYFWTLDALASVERLKLQNSKFAGGLRLKDTKQRNSKYARGSICGRMVCQVFWFSAFSYAKPSNFQGHFRPTRSAEDFLSCSNEYHNKRSRIRAWRCRRDGWCTSAAPCKLRARKNGAHLFLVRKSYCVAYQTRVSPGQVFSVCILCLGCSQCFVYLFLVVLITSAINCLERLVSEMIYSCYVM